MDNDARLIRDIIRKRNKAVETLYDTYSPLLLGIGLRYCGNRQDAEDVLHESFIRILNNIHSFRYKNKGSLINWMKKIVVNTSINSLRHKFDDIPVSDTIQVSDEQNFFAGIEKMISKEEILNLISSLPVGYKTVFNMYVFDEFSHKEIAEELNISENTSKTQLLKARAQLKKGIDELIKCKEHLYEKAY